MSSYYSKENEDSDTISLVKEKSISEGDDETINIIQIQINRPSVLRGITSYIIVTEFCERLSYYGFAGSLVLFLQRQFNQTNAEADVTFSLWSGFCYLTPLIGGYFADKRYGRYYTIVFFSIIYVIGLLLTVISAQPSESISNKNNLAITFYIAIYIIALATGGIKPNVSSLGADQFDMEVEQDRKEKESFFNYFYWSVNLGALLAYTIVTYICQYGIVGVGGEKYSFVVGYSIPLIAMFLGLLVFISGSKRYKKYPPNGSAIDTTLSIIYEALWIKRRSTIDNKSSYKMLDKAKLSNGGSYTDHDVNNVMLVLRLLPFLAAFIPYWGVYSQMSTAFQNQACQMDLSYGNTQIPVASINAVDTIIILILVPIFDQYLYPYLKQKDIIKIDMLSKINYGFLFATVSMIAAAIIEVYRKRYSPTQGNYYDINARNNISPCRDIYDYNPYEYVQWYNNTDHSVENKPLNCYQIKGCSIDSEGIQCIQCDNIPQMSTLSVFWQIPQFCLIGISEILASVTSLEFFYSQAPITMISFVQAFNLVTTAFGSWLVIPLIILANCDPNNPWVPVNLDDGSLELYFILLIIIMVLTIFCFMKISRKYEYINNNELNTDENTNNEGEINLELNKL